MSAERDEVSYYPEIVKYVSEIMNANFSAAHSPVRAYFKYGKDLSKGIRELTNELSLPTKTKERLLKRAPALKLDIFCLLYDGKDFTELLILEIKLLNKVGLNQYSQLLGYCLASDAEYGILINVNGMISDPLVDCLSTNERLSRIYRDKLSGGKSRHVLGIMTWDSSCQNLNYYKLGQILNIEALCASIMDDYAIHLVENIVNQN